MIAPGKTIGIFGGGQLGRMSAIAARKMGYRIHIFEPGENSPAGQVADVEVNASYRDEERVQRFLQEIEVATFEFENIPAQTLHRAAALRPVRPSPDTLLISQNREREKNFLHRHGFPLARFAVVSNPEELAQALETIGRPCVLKTADFGYDGKGQIKIGPDDEAGPVWARFNAPRGVVEEWVRYQAELSVICAANPSGQFSTFPVSENIHTDHILEYSIVPARLPQEIQEQAAEIATEIARAIGLVGLLAVEFFFTEDGRLLVNELAPRPHNSGHFTFDGCVTSQFEQQIRAVCDLPLGSPRLFGPIVMCNLLGDLWKGGTPNWTTILEKPEAKLHLYGKEEARPGRKMGHFNVMAPTVEEAFATARSIKERLKADARAEASPYRR